MRYCLYVHVETIFFSLSLGSPQYRLVFCDVCQRGLYRTKKEGDKSKRLNPTPLSSDPFTLLTGGTKNKKREFFVDTCAATAMCVCDMSAAT